MGESSSMDDIGILKCSGTKKSSHAPTLPRQAFMRASGSIISADVLGDGGADILDDEDLQPACDKQNLCDSNLRKGF